MEGPPDFAGFADVDAAADAGAYAGYLDTVRDIPAVAEWKERSFAALEPRPGAVLLDVGCGTGEDVRALAGLVAPGGVALGVDASAGMVEEALRRHGDLGAAARFVHADAAAMPLGDGSADGARAERTLQHVASPGSVLAEMARVVRPGGVVVAAEPDWGTLLVDPGDPGVGREVALAAVRRVRSGLVGRALRRLLVDAGLTDVAITARALVIDDLGRAQMLLDLDGALDRAVADGAVDPAFAAGWRADLVRADAAGRVLCAMTAFMAWGRVGQPVAGSGR